MAVIELGQRHVRRPFCLWDLQVELESLLGVRVDLLTPEDLSLRFSAKVLAEAQGTK